MEKLIKKITHNNKTYNIYKQNMWLIIADKNNIEINRIELFGKEINDGIKDLIAIIN